MLQKAYHHTQAKRHVYMRHIINNIQHLEDEKFMDAFKNIPAGTTQLNLRGDFANKTIEEIAKAFTDIPLNVESIIVEAEGIKLLGEIEAVSDLLVSIKKNITFAVSTRYTRKLCDYINNKYRDIKSKQIISTVSSHVPEEIAKIIVQLATTHSEQIKVQLDFSRAVRFFELEKKRDDIENLDNDEDASYADVSVPRTV